MKLATIVACKAGGFVFATLALQINIPFLLIREAGKVPPPRVSVPKNASHISRSVTGAQNTASIAIERGVLPKGKPVMSVDDVLSTGETLCAVLELFQKAGAKVEDVAVMVVAEFTYHWGSHLLHERSFGNAHV